MLVRFTIENFKSFRDNTTLDCRAASIDGLESNTISLDNRKLLKSISILGANASGKSNFLKGLTTMRYLVINSISVPLDVELLPIEPFRLNNRTEKEPSFFEVEFIAGSKQFIYGLRADKERIHQEWLFQKLKTTTKLLFSRDKNKYEFDKTWKASQPIVKFTTEKSLFLSVASKFNITKAQIITGWFLDLNTMKGLSFEDYMNESFQLLNQKNGKKLFIKLLQAADVGIQNVKLKKIEVPDTFVEYLKEEYKEKYLETNHDDEYLEVKTVHTKYNDSGKVLGEVEFDLGTQESEGTRKFFSLVGMIMNSIMRGEILIIDELDARLHPDLVNNVLNLFNSEINEKSQLICINMHSEVLEKGLLRRDQIYFTEKDHFEVSRLSSMVEFKLRKNQPMDKHYREGKVGGKPEITRFEQVF